MPHRLLNPFENGTTKLFHEMMCDKASREFLLEHVYKRYFNKMFGIDNRLLLDPNRYQAFHNPHETSNDASGFVNAGTSVFIDQQIEMQSTMTLGEYQRRRYDLMEQMYSRFASSGTPSPIKRFVKYIASCFHFIDYNPLIAQMLQITSEYKKEINRDLGPETGWATVNNEDLKSKNADDIITIITSMSAADDDESVKHTMDREIYGHHHQILLLFQDGMSGYHVNDANELLNTILREAFLMHVNSCILEDASLLEGNLYPLMEAIIAIYKFILSRLLFLIVEMYRKHHNIRLDYQSVFTNDQNIIDETKAFTINYVYVGSTTNAKKLFQSAKVSKPLFKKRILYSYLGFARPDDFKKKDLDDFRLYQKIAGYGNREFNNRKPKWLVRRSEASSVKEAIREKKYRALYFREEEAINNSLEGFEARPIDIDKHFKPDRLIKYITKHFTDVEDPTGNKFPAGLGNMFAAGNIAEVLKNYKRNTDSINSCITNITNLASTFNPNVYNTFDHELDARDHNGRIITGETHINHVDRTKILIDSKTIFECIHSKKIEEYLEKPAFALVKHLYIDLRYYTYLVSFIHGIIPFCSTQVSASTFSQFEFNDEGERQPAEQRQIKSAHINQLLGSNLTSHVKHAIEHLNTLNTTWKAIDGKRIVWPHQTLVYQEIGDTLDTRAGKVNQEEFNRIIKNLFMTQLVHNFVKTTFARYAHIAHQRSRGEGQEVNYFPGFRLELYRANIGDESNQPDSSVFTSQNLLWVGEILQDHVKRGGDMIIFTSRYRYQRTDADYEDKQELNRKINDALTEGVYKFCIYVTEVSSTTHREKLSLTTQSKESESTTPENGVVIPLTSFLTDGNRHAEWDISRLTESRSFDVFKRNLAINIHIYASQALGYRFMSRLLKVNILVNKYSYGFYTSHQTFINSVMTIRSAQLTDLFILNYISYLSFIIADTLRPTSAITNDLTDKFRTYLENILNDNSGNCPNLAESLAVFLHAHKLISLKQNAPTISSDKRREFYINSIVAGYSRSIKNTKFTESSTGTPKYVIEDKIEEALQELDESCITCEKSIQRSTESQDIEQNHQNLIINNIIRSVVEKIGADAADWRFNGAGTGAADGDIRRQYSELVDKLVSDDQLGENTNFLLSAEIIANFHMGSTDGTNNLIDSTSKVNINTVRQVPGFIIAPNHWQTEARINSFVQTANIDSTEAIRQQEEEKNQSLPDREERMQAIRIVGRQQQRNMERGGKMRGYSASYIESRTRRIGDVIAGKMVEGGGYGEDLWMSEIGDNQAAPDINDPEAFPPLPEPTEFTPLDLSTQGPIAHDLRYIIDYLSRPAVKTLLPKRVEFIKEARKLGATEEFIDKASNRVLKKFNEWKQKPQNVDLTFIQHRDAVKRGARGMDAAVANARNEEAAKRAYSNIMANAGLDNGPGAFNSELGAAPPTKFDRYADAELRAAQRNRTKHKPKPKPNRSGKGNRR